MSETTTRVSGKVQKFFEEKGYGFLCVYAGRNKSYFFHIKEWKLDIPPEIDMSVTFSIHQKS
eukprot:UN00989